MIREAAVAGQFYPADPLQLEATLRQQMPTSVVVREAKGIVVPHASYLYSGRVAGRTYAAVSLPRLFVILCPNHTGLDSPLSIMSRGAWQTPLGPVEIDENLSDRIGQACGLLQENPQAHRREHALEVQLPFLQHLLENDLRFVPIALGSVPYEGLVELGKALGEAVVQTSEPILLIASSDMNHFEPAERTLRKDQMAIEKILELDSQGLYEVVHRENISMCGYGPTICVMEACLLLGAQRAELIEHTHSGETTGEHNRVVGYAGLVIH